LSLLPLPQLKYSPETPLVNLDDKLKKIAEFPTLAQLKNFVKKNFACHQFFALISDGKAPRKKTFHCVILAHQKQSKPPKKIVE